MNQRWRRWAPVLAAALGFAVLAWLVSSAALSGHQLVTLGVPPAGIPPKALEYLPEDFVQNFPDEADLTTDSAGDLPPGLLDDLGSQLSAAELAELAQVLSDDLVVELAEQKAADLTPEQLQDLWDGLEPETRQRLLDRIGGTYTQDELDRIADRLSPELYEELSKRARPEPDTEPTGDTGTAESPADEPTGESSAPPSSPPAPTASDDEAADEEKDPPGALDWLRDLGQFALFAVKWLVILAVAALAGYILYRIIAAFAGRRPRRKTTPAPPSKPDEPEVDKLREAVAEGLSDVADAADPRRGVIACWQRLERAAAAAGLARRESETPGELVSRVLTAANVDSGALNDLADTYRRARYAPHEIGEDLRARAVAALAAVDEQLAARLESA